MIVLAMAARGGGRLGPLRVYGHTEDGVPMVKARRSKPWEPTPVWRTLERHLELVMAGAIKPIRPGWTTPKAGPLALAKHRVEVEAERTLDLAAEAL